MSFHSLMHLLQLSDSALPVGAFSFSNTLESATAHALVSDEDSLECYVTESVRAVAMTDGIAALHARRRAIEGIKADIIAADQALMRSKLNDEARLLSQRMGRKLTELALTLIEARTNEGLLHWWHEAISQGHTAGTYAATQGIVAALCGIDGRGLFCSICYGSASMMLGAALRTMRTTHLTTQRILFDIGYTIGDLYAEACTMSPEQMNAFTPQMDIMAALHEKGDRRLFMN